MLATDRRRRGSTSSGEPTPLDRTSSARRLRALRSGLQSGLHAGRCTHQFMVCVHDSPPVAVCASYFNHVSAACPAARLQPGSTLRNRSLPSAPMPLFAWIRVRRIRSPASCGEYCVCRILQFSSPRCSWALRTNDMVVAARRGVRTPKKDPLSFEGVSRLYPLGGGRDTELCRSR